VVIVARATLELFRAGKLRQINNKSLRINHSLTMRRLLRLSSKNKEQAGRHVGAVSFT
jgi:hypothetical protein